MDLRPYQQDFEARVRAEFAGGARSVLAVLPTGGGKTVVYSHMVKQAVAAGRKVLVVAHRRELIIQGSAKLDDMGVPSGGIMAGVEIRPREPVQVASIATIAKRKARPPADLIIIDEAHHAAAKTYGELLKVYPDAWIVGFTATPQRGDGTALGDVFDRMVVGPSVAELMEMGHLVPCDLYGPEKKGSLLARDPVEAWERFAEGQGFIFAQSIPASKDIVKRLRANGVHARHIDKDTHYRYRADSIRKFRSGEVEALSSVGVFTEGVDLPMARTCLLAGTVNHVSGYLQRAGRVLRPHPGKERARIVDLLGVVWVLGLPDEVREWSLEGSGVQPSEKRETWRCPKCLVVSRASQSRKRCPACGYVRPEAPDPQPNKVSQAEIKLITRSYGHTPQQKRDRWRELNNLEAAQGYRPGWAAERYDWQYGEEPTS